MRTYHNNFIIRSQDVLNSSSRTQSLNLRCDMSPLQVRWCESEHIQQVSASSRCGPFYVDIKLETDHLAYIYEMWSIYYVSLWICCHVDDGCACNPYVIDISRLSLTMILKWWSYHCSCVSYACYRRILVYYVTLTCGYFTFLQDFISFEVSTPWEAIYTAACVPEATIFLVADVSNSRRVNFVLWDHYMHF